MYSLLHLSDLHRSPRDPISNTELVSALVADRDRVRLETPSVRAPDAIIVSGDVIQGVPLGTADFAAKLREQYQVAAEFLGELATRFLDGDRSKVVIVPGNHDVDWNTARGAFAEIPEAERPKDLARELFREDSKHRWSWKECKLYSLKDEALYEARLAAFWAFFAEFYRDVPGLLRVGDTTKPQLYSLHDGRIGVAAFNSCHGNDCFAFHGNIPREVIARAHLDLVDEKNFFELRIAVWHHSISGPPYRTDYMDPERVRTMIGTGFRLGLYGHQHRAQVTAERLYLPSKESMGVVAAGSLCAGAEELPTGVHRQYGIIELDDSLRRARVHVRAMLAQNVFGMATLNEFGGQSFIDIEWDVPRDLAGREEEMARRQISALVAGAEDALRAGSASRCADMLLGSVAKLPSHGRMLLVEALSESGRWEELVRVTSEATSSGEIVQRVQALIRLRRFDDGERTLAEAVSRHGFPDALAAELRQRIRGERMLNG